MRHLKKILDQIRTEYSRNSLGLLYPPLSSEVVSICMYGGISILDTRTTSTCVAQAILILRKSRDAFSSISDGQVQISWREKK